MLGAAASVTLTLACIVNLSAQQWRNTEDVEQRQALARLSVGQAAVDPRLDSFQHAVGIAADLKDHIRWTVQ